jgi:holo-[acyl-carrier protein] synthase
MIAGIGLDLAETTRYRFDAAQLEQFARKVYTDEEVRYASRKRNQHEHFAGFFAAKEAVRKAFGFAIPWREIGVTHERGGRPAIALLGNAADLPRKHNVAKIHLTITHTTTTAAAFVVLEG